MTVTLAPAVLHVLTAADSAGSNDHHILTHISHVTSGDGCVVYSLSPAIVRGAGF